MVVPDWGRELRDQKGIGREKKVNLPKKREKNVKGKKRDKDFIIIVSSILDRGRPLTVTDVMVVVATGRSNQWFYIWEIKKSRRERKKKKKTQSFWKGK